MELSKQLTALSDSLRTTNTLINRLAKLQFQPGSEPLEGGGGVRVELAQDIHDSLKQLEDELELLREAAEDYNSQGQRRRNSAKDGEEARLSAKVARLGEELIHSRQQFRNAQVAAKIASDEAKRREREAVLEGYRKEAEQIAVASETANGSTADDRELLFSQRGGGRRQQQKQLTKDEVLVNASSDVTSSLRRTHDLLSTELSRASFAQETIDESRLALEKLGEDYSGLDTILSNSRNLLGTLLRSQKSDTWYLETAFYILLTTICWLVFRRILYGPFIKLPLFLWNVFAFLVNWVILRPLFFILSAAGVITSGRATTSLGAASGTVSSSRPPLIVQPSAKGRASPRPKDAIAGGIPAGAGGAGAKVGKGQTLEGEMSEKIGRMAEDSAKEAHKPSVRGDGTVLQERGEVPPNPKKKNFEADVEDAKQEKDSHKTGDEEVKAEHSQRRKRDEL